MSTTFKTVILNTNLIEIINGLSYFLTQYTFFISILYKNTYFNSHDK